MVKFQRNIGVILVLALLLSGCSSNGLPIESTAITYRTIPVKVTSRALVSINSPPGKAVVSDAWRSGCFTGQIDESPWADRMADATVQIVAIKKDKESVSQEWIGSGSIIRNSRVEDEKHNRILTASHVVEEAEGDGGTVGILTSSGKLIGTARIIAKGERSSERDLSNTFRRGDLAVLSMLKFFPDQDQQYDLIEGVDLAQLQGKHELKGLFSKPAGIAPGASGGPAFDKNGKVIGIASARQDSENSKLWKVTTQVEGGAAVLKNDRNEFEIKKTKVNLPVKAWGFIEPIGDSKILQALGPAGKTVEVSDNAPSHYEDVQITGYPAMLCVVYHGNLESIH